MKFFFQTMFMYMLFNRFFSTLYHYFRFVHTEEKNSKISSMLCNEVMGFFSNHVHIYVIYSFKHYAIICVQFSTFFQDLFVQLIETHIIGDQSHCASILVKQLDIEPIKSQGLPKGLRKLLYHQDYPNHSNNRAHTPSNDRMLTIGTLSKPVHKAFLSACQLLVDFSCFPMCCTETPKPSNNNSKGKQIISFVSQMHYIDGFASKLLFF